MPGAELAGGGATPVDWGGATHFVQTVTVLVLLTVEMLVITSSEVVDPTM